MENDRAQNTSRADALAQEVRHRAAAILDSPKTTHAVEYVQSVATYQGIFEGGGKAKAQDALRFARPLLRAEEVRKTIYLSLGGGDGSELSAAMVQGGFEKGFLLEWMDEAVDAAKEKIPNALQSWQEVRYITGDVAQKFEQIERQLHKWHQAGMIGLLISAQAVLHELPWRADSKRFSWEKIVSLFDPFHIKLFHGREPCLPPSDAGWRNRVRIRIPHLPGAELCSAMEFIQRHYLAQIKGEVWKAFEGAIVKVGDTCVAPGPLAVEFLHKFMRHRSPEHLRHELQECLTAFDPEPFAQQLQATFGGAPNVQVDYITTEGFRNEYARFGVEATSAELPTKQLRVPQAFCSIRASQQDLRTVIAPNVEGNATLTKLYGARLDLKDDPSRTHEQPPAPSAPSTLVREASGPFELKSGWRIVPFVSSFVARNQILQLLALGFSVGIFFAVAQHVGWLERLELMTIDVRFRLAPALGEPSSVIIVIIDQQSKDQLSPTAPLSRGRHIAELINRLADAGAASVGVDLLFADNSSSLDDGELAISLRDTPVAVLAMDLQLDSPSPDGPRPSQDVPFGWSLGVASPAVLACVGIELPVNSVAQKASRVGHVTLLADEDGIIRRLPVVLSYNGRTYPSLSLATVMAAKGVSQQEVRIANNKILELVLRQDRRLRIPIQKGCVMQINYRHGAESPIRIPLWRVLKLSSKEARSLFKGKVVLIGSGLGGETDVGPTPLHPSIPLVDAHAQAVDTILRESFVSPTTPSATTVAILIVPVLILMSASRLGRFWGVLTTAILIGGYVGLAFWMFSLQTRLVLPLISPTVAGIASHFLWLIFKSDRSSARIFK